MARASALAGWLMPSILRRNRALVLLSVLGIAIFGTVVPLASDTADSAATAKEGLGSPALRAVMLSASTPGGGADGAPLTGENLAEVQAVDGVEDAVGWAQALLTIQHGAASVFPDLTPRFAPLQPSLLSGREPTADGEVLVSASMLSELGVEVGDAADASYNRFVSKGIQEGVEAHVTVVGVYDGATVGLDGDMAVYGTPDWADAVIAAQQGVPPDDLAQGIRYQYIYAVSSTRDTMPELVDTLVDRGYTASSLGSLLSGVQPVQSALDLARIVLASLLVVFLLVVGGTAATALVSAKRGEIGLLRAFGWPRSQVLWAFLAQFLMLGAVIAIAGVAVSAVVLAVLAAIFPAGLFGLPVQVGLSGLSLTTLGAFLLAPPIVFGAAAFLPAYRAASVPPDEVLRDVDG